MTRDRLKEFAAPAIGVLAVALVAAVLGYLTADTRGARAPGPPPVEAQAQQVSGQIGAVSGDSITIASESGVSKTYKLGPGVRVEALRAAALGDIQPGDWLNGGGIGHPQSLYALTGFVVIKPAELAPR